MPDQLTTRLRAERYGRTTVRLPLDVVILYAVVQNTFHVYLTTLSYYNQTRVGEGIVEVVKDAGLNAADFIVLYVIYKIFEWSSHMFDR